METVRVMRAEEFSINQYLKESPLKTDKVAFSIYNFRPWQALPIHRHPRNDTVLYAVEGRGTLFINDERTAIDTEAAVYVPAGMSYGILAGENDLAIIAVQGPTPIEAIFDEALAHECPACGLRTPVIRGMAEGSENRCPRCNAILKLTREEGELRAAEAGKPGPGWIEPAGARETEARKAILSDTDAGPARIALNLFTFDPWTVVPMHRHPGSDSVLYVIEGQGIIFVGDEEQSIDASVAVYVPADATYGILAADNDMTVLSVQGPTPVETVFSEELEYECPVCDLETPVAENARDGCVTVCPRCNVKLKLEKEADGFSAEETRDKAPAEEATI